VRSSVPSHHTAQLAPCPCAIRWRLSLWSLGHSAVSIALDTYSHAIPAMQEEAAALIAGLVFAE